VPRPQIEPYLPAERIRLHVARGEWPLPGPSAALAERAATDPERVLYVVGDERLTAVDVLQRSERLASGLADLGVSPGDVVSWQLPNWIEGVYLTFALERLGALSNPILPIFREREVRFIAGQAQSRMLVVPGVYRGFDHRDLARAVQAEAPRLERVLVARADPLAGQGRLEDALAPATTRALPPSPFGPNDVAWLFYTSGTTSEPKGVMHTASTLGAFIRMQGVFANPDHGEHVSILTFPLTHLGGIASFAMGAVIQGSRAVFLEPFDAAAALDLIEREGVTTAGGPTPILQAILGCPTFHPDRVRSVQVSGIGATDVPPELIRAVAQGFGAFTYRSYGMTECPMATAGRRGDPEEKLVRTDGRATPGVIVRMVDDAGRPVPPGAEGELELFGPQLCVGYLDPAQSREAFTPDGFLRSGDLGVMDEDGFVRITGRKKDIIIRKGENLSAKAIEDELYDHPKVADVAVIGVPDPESGERVCACVVLAPNAAPLTLREVREFMLSRGLMAQKVPEQLEIIDALPRNATGKVTKFELRRRFRESARGTGR
jgi:cyclohexanecarboxylate-CoA ligase